MKSPFRLTHLLLIVSLGFTACDELFDDEIPPSFKVIELNPDVIYVWNGGSPHGSRLDPLLNDSIKVPVNVTYSAPSHGVINFLPNEGWFYKPNEEFFGEDNFTYTACDGNNCRTGSITMIVEEPLDPNNCTSVINAETVETQKGKPVEIRVFLNDIVCPFSGISLDAPEKGRFNTYSYSGNYKSIVYVYYPPQGFVGTDRFRYRILTNDGDLVAYCTINVTE